MHTSFMVKKVAVLGAGVMGAQIAAHFSNAGISVVLFDLKSSDSNNPNQLILKALDGLKKLNPKPLALEKNIEYIEIGNYDDSLNSLAGCDLIIEAIAERLDLKENLYHKIAPFIASHTIIASNTSGLSINELLTSLPNQLHSRFCGIHFFNPPRYMPLVELIPSQHTTDELMDNLETFLVHNLGKTVVRAKDTPNFIANRLGVFSILSTSIHAKNLGIGLEVIDKLTGKDLGRAKSATYRTLDIVGLDTFSHVVKTMTNKCNDGFNAYYTLPKWMEELIAKGALGQKTKVGCYRKDKDGLKVLDLNTLEYREANEKAEDEVLQIIRQKNWQDKIKGLRESSSPGGQFLWACFRDIFHYAAVMLGEIADSPREMDMAIRAGFGWKEGIFEIWQQAGWLQVASWIKEDLDSDKTIAKVPLPNWVFELSNGVYQDNKHYNIRQNQFVERKLLPIYHNQIFPELLLKETADVAIEVLYENDGVRLWHSGDNIGILSFKSKMCAIGMDVLLGIEEAINVAEAKCRGMVIWQEKDIFSVGANLEEFGFSIMMNGAEAVDNIIATGHRIISRRIRYSYIPIVAAVKGYTFGGGCEIMLHCDRVVAALESYIGLVEAGVGLLPGWGGSTEMAFRASQSIEPWKDFERRYKNLALAKVATSALEAREMGFLRESDIVVMNSKEVLKVAKKTVKLMDLAGYRPMRPASFEVFGEQGIATVTGLLTNMKAGGQISEHDYLIAKNLAIVMCGGEVEKNSQVNQEWLLKLEQEKFKELALSDKTSERIQYMLANGKPLRN